MIQPSKLTYELEGVPSQAVLDLIASHGGSYTGSIESGVVAGNQAVFPTAWHRDQFAKALQHLQEGDIAESTDAADDYVDADRMLELWRGGRCE